MGLEHLEKKDSLIVERGIVEIDSFYIALKDIVVISDSRGGTFSAFMAGGHEIRLPVLLNNFDVRKALIGAWKGDR